MNVSSIEYPELEKTEKGEALFYGNFDLIKNAEIELEVVVGSKKITIKELYSLKVGSTVHLQQLLSEPVALVLNGKTIAHGELVAIDDSFGLRITDIDQ
jgi:flagellar motor switch protein FliN/FliY